MTTHQSTKPRPDQASVSQGVAVVSGRILGTSGGVRKEGQEPSCRARKHRMSLLVALDAGCFCRLSGGGFFMIRTCSVRNNVHAI